MIVNVIIYKSDFYSEIHSGRFECEYLIAVLCYWYLKASENYKELQKTVPKLRI